MAGPAAAAATAARLRVIILPGNGEGCARANFYPWLQKGLARSGLFSDVLLRDMPDGDTARESVWLPFIREVLRADARTIVVGHSSGAEAAMRLAEDTRVAGLVLVSACVSDLGDAHEAASGYYNRPWRWEAIRANAGFILQFGSDDDPFIPLEGEMHAVRDGLRSEFVLLRGRGHFMDRRFPELLAVLEAKARELAAGAAGGAA